MAQRTVDEGDNANFRFIEPNEHSQAIQHCKSPNLTNSLCLGVDEIEWTTSLEVEDYTITVTYEDMTESITLNRTYMSKNEISALIQLPDEYIPTNPYYLHIRSNTDDCIEDNNIFEDERILHLVYKPCDAARYGQLDIPPPPGSKGFATLDTPGKNSKSTQLPNSTLVIAPNPVQDKVQINLDLPQTDQVTLTLYNTNGQAVKQLLSTQVLQSGEHYFDWDISDLPASVYYCNIQTGGMTLSKKVIKMD